MPGQASSSGGYTPRPKKKPTNDKRQALKSKSWPLARQYAQAQKASAWAEASMQPFTGTSSPSGSTRFATAMKNRAKIESAMNLEYKKARRPSAKKNAKKRTY